MTNFSRLLPLLAASLLPATAAAVDPEHDHSHGAGATTVAPALPASPSRSGAADTGAIVRPAPADNGRVDRLLQRMREQSESLRAARTAAERQRLLAESRRQMQEGMELLRTQPPAHDMATRHHGDGSAAPAMPGGQHGAPGAMMGEPGAAEGRKRMGEKPMQQCHEMHSAQARHMELMHAVLQALVDQQAAATGK